MTALAPTLQAFFTTRLGRQRDASPHTIDSYRHAFRLLLTYAKAQTGKNPSDLDLADLDADLISGFLDHLERERGNGAGSRNTRLAAIHSFFRFAARPVTAAPTPSTRGPRPRSCRDRPESGPRTRPGRAPRP
jgi:integrase/recombinase XerD